jgi:hypothetical protein
MAYDIHVEETIDIGAPARTQPPSKVHDAVR